MIVLIDLAVSLSSLIGCRRDYSGNYCNLEKFIVALYFRISIFSTLNPGGWCRGLSMF